MTNARAVEAFWNWHLSWMHREATAAVAAWSAHAAESHAAWLRTGNACYATEERRALREVDKHRGLAEGYATRPEAAIAGEWP